jgi:hypothetical protein
MQIEGRLQMPWTNTYHVTGYIFGGKKSSQKFVEQDKSWVNLPDFGIYAFFSSEMVTNMRLESSGQAPKPRFSQKRFAVSSQVGAAT